MGQPGRHRPADVHHDRQQRQHPRGLGLAADSRRPLPGAVLASTQQYTQPFTDAWNNSKCSPTELIPGGNDIEFSVTNLFVTHNRMHDFSYYLGFNEGNYNLQLDNLGRGGMETTRRSATCRPVP